MKVLFIASIVSIVAFFVLGFFALVTDDDDGCLFKAFSVVKYFAIVGMIFLASCCILSKIKF